jgi:hypothetical protein
MKTVLHAAIATLSLATIAVASRAIAFEPDYFCYMQTPSGKVINLTQVCTDGATAASSISTSDAASYQSTPQSTSQSKTDQNKELVYEGQGGYYNSSQGKAFDYKYQIWKDKSTGRFTLKVWKTEEYPDGSVTFERSTFSSAREALDYFDCKYGGKPDLCKKN